MKTITGHPLVRYHNDAHRLGDESMRKVVGTVIKYFHTCISHGGCDEIPRNAFCCYTSVYLNPNVTNKIYLRLPDRLERLVQDNDSGYKVFFDTSLHIESYYSQTDVVSIYVAGKFAGYYVPSHNTLLCTDWTHSTRTLEVFSAIWPQLIEQLALQLIGPKKEDIIEVREITVGCDPEFELLDNDGEVIEASGIIDDDNGDESIGLDGSDDQVEFRPQPGTPAQVVRNIKSLIKAFAEEHPTYDLSDKGDIFPLGGHIHIGVGETICPDSDLVTLLDDFIGRPTIDLSGTARDDYKRLSAVRKQPWGFEYRSMPSAVFQNPVIAHSVLKVAKNLCIKYFAGETFVYNEEPTIQDYMTIGGLTKKQAEMFTKFVATDFRPAKSICAAWKVPKPIVASPDETLHTTATNVTVRFRDHWSSSARSNIMTASRNIVSDRPITVVFYGLNRGRGNDICTLEHDLCTVADDRNRPFPTWEDDNQILYIGVSRNRREYSTLGSLFARILVESINQEISRRFH